MKITKYTCDSCGKVLSDNSQGIGIEHISMEVSNWGWVKQDKDGKWGVGNDLKKTGIQVCDENCLRDFFMKTKFRQFIKKSKTEY